MVNYVLLFVVYLSANSLAAGYSLASFDHSNSSPLLSVSYGHPGNSFSLRTIQKTGGRGAHNEALAKGQFEFRGRKAAGTSDASSLPPFRVLRSSATILGHRGGEVIL